jgi:hypothetical protein
MNPTDKAKPLGSSIRWGNLFLNLFGCGFARVVN